MTVKPILFATPMVKAILKGDKTETRRLIGADTDWPLCDLGEDCVMVCTDKNGVEHEKNAPGLWASFEGWNGYTDFPMFKAPYKTGDVLYVRETWAEWEGGYVYKADVCSEYPHAYIDRWRPSIHMPKTAARIFLNVTDIRVEHLRDITDEGASREGFYKGWRLCDRGSLALSARQAFMWQWETLTRDAPAAASWSCNPWVWVISFERCEKPEAWPCCE